jgi:hypothetical protein
MVREQAAATRLRRLPFALQAIEAVGGSRIAIVDAQISPAPSNKDWFRKLLPIVSSSLVAREGDV